MATVTCFYGDTIPPGYSVHTVYVVAVLKLNIDLRKTRRTHKKKHSPGDLCLDLHSLDATQEEKKSAQILAAGNLLCLQNTSLCRFVSHPGTPQNRDNWLLACPLFA